MVFSQIDKSCKSLPRKNNKKLKKILPKSLIFKIQKFQSRLYTKSKKKRVPSAIVFLIMKIKKYIQSMYQKMFNNRRKIISNKIIINKKILKIINWRKRQTTLCSSERFQYVNVWPCFTLWEKTFLLLLFTSF